MKIKDQINEKYTYDSGVISEEVTKGFQNCIKFLDDKLAKAGSKTFMKGVIEQSLDIANLEPLGTRLLKIFDNQFEGNEAERIGKLYDFLDQMRNDVISANK